MIKNSKTSNYLFVAIIIVYEIIALQIGTNFGVFITTILLILPLIISATWAINVINRENIQLNNLLKLIENDDIKCEIHKFVSTFLSESIETHYINNFYQTHFSKHCQDINAYEFKFKTELTNCILSEFTRQKDEFDNIINIAILCYCDEIEFTEEELIKAKYLKFESKTIKKMVESPIQMYIKKYDRKYDKLFISSLESYWSKFPGFKFTNSMLYEVNNIVSISRMYKNYIVFQTLTLSLKKLIQ